MIMANAAHKGKHAKQAPQKKHALACRLSVAGAFLAAAGATVFINNAHTVDPWDFAYPDEGRLSEAGYFATAQEIPGEIYLADARSAPDGKVKIVFYDIAHSDVEKYNVKYGGVYFVTALCTADKHPSCSVTKVRESKTQGFRPLVQGVR